MAGKVQVPIPYVSFGPYSDHFGLSFQQSQVHGDTGLGVLDIAVTLIEDTATPKTVRPWHPIQNLKRASMLDHLDGGAQQPRRGRLESLADCLQEPSSRGAVDDAVVEGEAEAHLVARYDLIFDDGWFAADSA